MNGANAGPVIPALFLDPDGVLHFGPGRPRLCLHTKTTSAIVRYEHHGWYDLHTVECDRCGHKASQVGRPAELAWPAILAPEEQK